MPAAMPVTTTFTSSRSNASCRSTRVNRRRRFVAQSDEEREKDRADFLIRVRARLAGALRDQAIADHRFGCAQEGGGDRFVADVGAEGAVTFAAVNEDAQQIFEIDDGFRQQDL